MFGSIDLLRFVIDPAAREYAREQGLSFYFSQLLRILDDPVSLLDPTGFMSERDTIIGHLMQVVHLDPIYDLQLLHAFPNGLDALEAELEQMIRGEHPRSRTVAATMEQRGYHQALLDYVRRFRRDPNSPRLRRAQPALRRDLHFQAAERTFSTLPGFIDYCCQLPTDTRSLVRRVRRVSKFPLEFTASAREVEQRSGRLAG